MALFQFQKFGIYQSDDVFKIGTDTILMGAWSGNFSAKHVLEIGTGTGTIAIMLAQRFSTCSIFAIDVQLESAKLSSENFKNCPWANRLKSQHVSLQSYADIKPGAYDLIVSNPPFYSSGLRSNNANLSISKHTDLLSEEDFVSGSSKLLSADGILQLILPYDKSLEFIKLCKKYSLFPSNLIAVQSIPTKKPHRMLLEFTRNKSDVEYDILCIQKSNIRHDYSDRFLKMVENFYLHPLVNKA